MPLGLIAVRAIHFWLVAILLGGGGFLRMIGPRRVPGGVLVLRLASGLAALTGMSWFTYTFNNVTGGVLDSQALLDFLTSPFGPPWAIQLILCGIALALCAAGRPTIFAIVGAALAIDQAWLGHAATGNGWLGVTMVVSYAAHVLAGFLWVGALTMLCISPRRSGVFRDGLTLFSTLGLVLVATLLASGCLNASFHMTRLADLTTTPYGRIILVKVVLFALMVGLATFNRREGRRDGSRGLLVSVGLETALGLLVLGAAAALGITAPSN